MKCEFCINIGSWVSVDLKKGEAFPSEINNFEIILTSYFGYSILRCPQCQTYYQNERFIDNEIVYGYDVEELTEISQARVNELITFEKKMKGKR